MDDVDRYRSLEELHNGDETSCGLESNRSEHEHVTKNSETKRATTWDSEVESNKNGVVLLIKFMIAVDITVAELTGMKG